MSAPEVFPVWVRRLLLPLSALGLGVTLFAMVFHDPTGEGSHGNDPYSRSALGYGALVRYVELHKPVLVSRGYAVDRAGYTSPLVLLEPPLQATGRLRTTFEQALWDDLPGVLVLPKWRGLPDPARPGWVREVQPVPESMALEPLAELLKAVETYERELAEELEMEVRPEAGERGARPALVRSDTASAEMTWDWRLVGAPRAPALPEPQLLTGGEGWLDPLLSTGEGVLVAAVTGTSWIVVSDPDFLNNAGLAREDNGEIALRVLLDATGADGLVIDAAVHGYEQAESVWRALLEPPLLYLSIPLTLTALLLLWAGARGFGRPLAPPPRVPPGYGTLLDNSARLLAVGGRRGRRVTALRRYLRLHVRQVSERLGIPGHLSSAERAERLRSVGERRGVSEDVTALASATEPDEIRGADLLALARRIHTWRKEILDGPEPSP